MTMASLVLVSSLVVLVSPEDYQRIFDIIWIDRAAPDEEKPALAHAATRAWQAPGIDRIPKKVMDTLNARFPGATIEKWTVEKEADRELYDIEFRQKARKMEADIYADGSLHNWERAIAVRDVPLVVTKAVARRYPKASLVEAMAVTAVASGKEALEGYEIVLKTADGRDVELTVAPDGTILEDSGDKK